LTLGDEWWSSQYSARCTCGYGILACELWLGNDDFGVVRHFDNEETSETYAAPVTRCPGCG
jgi:hypothetical protein